MPNDEITRIDCIDRFEDVDYVRCKVIGVAECREGIIYKLERLIKSDKYKGIPDSLSIKDHIYLVDPRDFEPATEQEYQKQELMKELG